MVINYKNVRQSSVKEKERKVSLFKNLRSEEGYGSESGT